MGLCFILQHLKLGPICDHLLEIDSHLRDISYIIHVGGRGKPKVDPK